jgi:hypothetical protein
VPRLRWSTHLASITASGFGLVALLSITSAALHAAGLSNQSADAAHTASSVALYLTLSLSMIGLMELMRVDGGPWRLMIPSALAVIYGFGAGWPYAAGNQELTPFQDGITFLVYVGGIGIWALATLRWARFPRWAGWLLVAQTAALVFGRIAGTRVPEFARMDVVAWIWVGTMLVLAFVLSRMDVGDFNSEGAGS